MRRYIRDKPSEKVIEPESVVQSISRMLVKSERTELLKWCVVETPNELNREGWLINADASA